MKQRAFNSLTILEIYHKLDKRGKKKQYCKCRCKCGIECEVEYHNVTSGNTKSCGCGYYKYSDILGKQFGRLTAIKPVKIARKGIRIKCKCKCGRVTYVKPTSLRSGHTQSCGRHNDASRKYDEGLYDNCYHVWWNMIQRCENKNSISYPNYGGRGIKVCKQWHDFGVFCADMGMRKEGLTLDRIDNNGDYCPENCRWISAKENMRNRSNTVWITYEGKKYLLIEFPHRNVKFLKNHRYDGTLLIDGGKYDNKKWYMKFHGIEDLENE
jgi:hypothetical protein